MQIPTKFKEWLKEIKNSKIISETRGDLRFADRGAFRATKIDIRTCFEPEQEEFSGVAARPATAKLFFQGRSRELEQKLLNQSLDKSNGTARNRITELRASKISGKGISDLVFLCLPSDLFN